MSKRLSRAKQNEIRKRYFSGLPVTQAELRSLDLATPPPYKRYPKGGHGSKNPSRRLTKLQKLAASTKRGKERRVAAALKKFLHAQNPAVKYDGAAIVKLKGGAVRITPIKHNPSAVYSVSTADSSGEVGQITARTKAEALKEARRIYGTHGDRDSFGRPRKVAVYVRKLYGG